MRNLATSGLILNPFNSPALSISAIIQSVSGMGFSQSIDDIYLYKTGASTTLSGRRYFYCVSLSFSMNSGRFPIIIRAVSSISSSFVPRLLWNAWESHLFCAAFSLKVASSAFSTASSSTLYFSKIFPSSSYKTSWVRSSGSVMIMSESNPSCIPSRLGV